jgi:predicted O-methyltransferase YrrM
MKASTLVRLAGLYTSNSPGILEQLRDQTIGKSLDSDMLSGPSTLTLLQILVMNMWNKKRILEVGTFTGLATLAMALVLPPDAQIKTIDFENGPAQELARCYWRAAGVERRINFLVGDAFELIPRIDGWFDLVYVDINNVDYQRCLEALRPKLVRGSMVVFDDALDGDLRDPISKKEEATREFLDKLILDKDFSILTLPIDEGVTIAVKN